MDLQELLDWKIPFVNTSVLNFLVAIVITILVYVILMAVVLPFARKGLKKAKVPPLLAELLSRIIKYLLMIAVLLVFLSAIGFDVSSMVLALSAVIGLVIAFGMSDSLNNLFAGIWIAMIRPFKMGDYVDVSGHSGTVSAVGIMATELIKPDNVFIVIPNKKVWGEAIVNYTRQPTRRINLDVGIAYDSDVQKALDIAMDLMRGDSRVLADPAPSIFMTELADSSVNLQLRPWVKTEDYWPTSNDLRRGILEALNAAGVEIPFPQMDVHMRGGAAPNPVHSM